jgi:hypothetical protein
MMQQAVVERLVEMVFAPAQDAARWFESLGFQVEAQEDGVFIVCNGNGTFRTAISDQIDPVNRAVCMAWVIAGMFWPTIFPGLLKEIGKQWRKRRAQARDTAPSPQQKPTTKGKEITKK